MIILPKLWAIISSIATILPEQFLLFTHEHHLNSRTSLKPCIFYRKKVITIYSLLHLLHQECWCEELMKFLTMKSFCLLLNNKCCNFLFRNFSLRLYWLTIGPITTVFHGFPFRATSELVYDLTVAPLTIKNLWGETANFHLVQIR